MQKLQCQSCNSSLEWNGQDEIVTCGYCGMRYQMRKKYPQEQAAENARKGNCVAARPVQRGGDVGKIYYNSWLPEGWDYEVSSDTTIFRYGASMGTPFVPYITIHSPDYTAYMRHYTSNAYMDPGPGGMPNTSMELSFMTGIPGTPMTPTGDVSFVGKGLMAGDRPSNDPSALGIPSFTRWRTILSASEYCDEIAMLDDSLSSLALVSVHDEMDDIARKRIAQVKKELPDMAASICWDWCRKLYRGTYAGSEYTMVCEAQISSSGFNVEEAQMRAEYEAARQQKQQQHPQQSGFFSGLMGAIGDSFSQMTMPTSQLPRWWQTDYEVVFICPTEQFEALYPHYLKFISTLELGKDFRAEEAAIRNQIQQEAMKNQNIIKNAQMQMAQDRAASMERRAAILADRDAHIGNVMHDMTTASAASNERVANMHSEMIGRYNVYRGTDGNLIQADTAFTHVFQGNVDGQDWLVGVEGDYLEPGVDFVPLDKIEGGKY